MLHRVGTRLYGATILARPVLLWPYLALPILLQIHFGADLFGANFVRIIYFVCFFFFNFIKIIFFSLSFFLFIFF